MLWLFAQQSFEGCDQDADRDMADESVVNPVAGEADDQVDILHGTNSVPCEWALGPIGQTWGNG